MNAVNYKVVTNHDAELLAADICELLSTGWELLGGVSCALSESEEYRYSLFSQAMIKRS